jgi:pseudouridine-5'-phosphate glycosidase
LNPQPSSLPKEIILSKEVARALQGGDSVVALESTVITHGLPYPENLALARDLETIITGENSVPATIAVIQGNLHVGIDSSQLEGLARNNSNWKISLRDFAPAITQKASGGTTVAGTMFIAEKVGIQIFATGGIGGVHRDAPFDVSADLTQLSRCRVVVVCAGAKAILDLPATIEKLETFGIPVIGYQTNEFPAFYSRESGLPVSTVAESPEEVAEIVKAHWRIGSKSSVLVVVPPPKEVAIPYKEIEKSIQQALEEAKKHNIRGQAVTPFLLSKVSEITKGKSLKTNLGLLKNNAFVASKIAPFLYPPKRIKSV